MMEQITLDMIPNSHTPIAHISQYDSGRHIGFNLKNITLTGSETVTLKIRKPDDELVSKTIENHTSYVEYVSEKADCDVSGKANCEIVISKDNVVIGSKNFIMKVEADAYDGANVITKTASGRIATFETNLADVLQSVKCEINASGGNGTPDNPIPIVGHSELNLELGVDNFLNETTFSQGSIDAGTGVEIDSPYRIRTDFIWLEEGEYLISSPNGFDIVADIYDENKAYKLNESYTVWASTPREISILSGGRYAKMLFRKPNNSSITPSEISGELLTKIVNTFTVAFGQTVYGGVLDVTRGKLTVTSAYLALNGSENWTDYAAYNGFQLVISDMKSGNFMDGKANYLQMLATHGHGIRFGANNNLIYCEEIITDMAEVSDLAMWKTYLSTHNLEIVYPLATPFDIELTPVQIEALLGVNNVYSNTGDTEVKYLKKA